MKLKEAREIISSLNVDKDVNTSRAIDIAIKSLDAWDEIINELNELYGDKALCTKIVKEYLNLVQN